MYERPLNNEPSVPPGSLDGAATYAEVSRWTPAQVALAETLASNPTFIKNLSGAARLQGSQSPEDVVQDGLIKVINGINNINTDTPGGLARQVGTRLAIDEHRRRAAKARVEDQFSRLHLPL